MEETHYSTSEELQATLQELNDMQEQVAHLQLFNEQLELDKNLLLETLCAQTKKLEHSLSKIDNLQKLVFSQYDDNEEKRAILSPSERELKLSELLRSCQSEKDELESHKAELTKEVEDLRDKLYHLDQEHCLLYDKFRYFSQSFFSKLNFKLYFLCLRLYEELFYKQNEFRSTDFEEDGQLVNKKLSTQSDKENDSECDQSVYNASETPNKLHAAKSLQEISFTNSGSFYSLDGLSNKITSSENSVEMLQFLVKQLQDSISHKESELKKLKDQLISMESEQKDQIAKLELQLKSVDNRNKELNERNEELYQRLKSTEEAKIESEIRAQKNLDEKREIRNILEDKDRRLAELEMKLSQKCKELSEIGDKMSLEQAEWKQFQRDLLTTVRVANDFKQETLAECKKLQFEKHVLEEKLLSYEGELHKCKNDNKKLHFTLRNNVPSGVNTESATSINSPSNNSISVPSVTSSPVKMSLNANSSDINNNGVAVVKPALNQGGTSPKLAMRIQNYEPNATNCQLNSTATRNALARSNSSQISVKSLIESIESHSKQKQQHSQNSSVSPICNRSNSVPLMGTTSSHDLIQRHIRQALVESVNGVSNNTTASSDLRSINSMAQTANIPSPVTILKDTNKPSNEKSFMSDILTSKIDSIRPRNTFRFVHFKSI